MARIRSIKPEFWTDGRMVRLPLEVRLFYIGMWNFADDWGVLADDPESLKLRIMPADDVDAAKIVAVLVDEGRVRRATAADGSAVLVIHRWAEHQRIDKRSEGRWGNPADFHFIQTNPHESPRIPTTPREESAGRERKGGEWSGGELKTVVAQAPLNGSALGVIFGAWKEATGHSRAILTPERQRVIKKALGVYPVDDLVDAVRGWRLSPHHRGENDRHTVYDDLELLLRDAKHIEQFRDLERGEGPAPPPIMPRGSEGVALAVAKLEAKR